MQMPLWMSREEEINEGSWNWLEKVVFESKEEAAHKSLWSMAEVSF